MTTYVLKVVMRPKTKSQGFTGVITHPKLVMVWWGISYPGATRIHFCNVGVKTNSEVYRGILNNVLPPLEETVVKSADKKIKPKKFLQPYQFQFLEESDKIFI